MESHNGEVQKIIFTLHARAHIQIVSGSLNFETEFVSGFFLHVYAPELETRVAINK